MIPVRDIMRYFGARKNWNSYSWDPTVLSGSLQLVALTRADRTCHIMQIIIARAQIGNLRNLHMLIVGIQLYSFIILSYLSRLHSRSKLVNFPPDPQTVVLRSECHKFHIMQIMRDNVEKLKVSHRPHKLSQISSYITWATEKFQSVFCATQHSQLQLIDEWSLNSKRDIIYENDLSKLYFITELLRQSKKKEWQSQIKKLKRRGKHGKKVPTTAHF